MVTNRLLGSRGTSTWLSRAKRLWTASTKHHWPGPDGDRPRRMDCPGPGLFLAAASTGASWPPSSPSHANGTALDGCSCRAFCPTLLAPLRATADLLPSRDTDRTPARPNTEVHALPPPACQPASLCPMPNWHGACRHSGRYRLHARDSPGQNPALPLFTAGPCCHCSCSVRGSVVPCKGRPPPEWPSADNGLHQTPAPSSPTKGIEGRKERRRGRRCREQVRHVPSGGSCCFC